MHPDGCIEPHGEVLVGEHLEPLGLHVLHTQDAFTAFVQSHRTPRNEADATRTTGLLGPSTLIRIRNTRLVRCLFGTAQNHDCVIYSIAYE